MLVVAVLGVIESAKDTVSDTAEAVGSKKVEVMKEVRAVAVPDVAKVVKEVGAVAVSDVAEEV